MSIHESIRTEMSLRPYPSILYPSLPPSLPPSILQQPIPLPRYALHISEVLAPRAPVEAVFLPDSLGLDGTSEDFYSNIKLHLQELLGQLVLAHQME